jgi:hypothetical protein
MMAQMGCNMDAQRMSCRICAQGARKCIVWQYYSWEGILDEGEGSMWGLDE